MKVCKIEDCNKEARCEELCWKHHNRLKKYGDPLGGRPYYGDLPVHERFMKYVEKVDSGCWHWLGATNQNYGRFGIKNKNLPAHRASVLLFHEHYPDFDKLLVCHKCDNTICVNPDHLFVGTHQDNIDDKMKKNRHVTLKGIDNPNAIIIEKDVIFIRESDLTTYDLALKFNLSTSSINFIRSGKRWKHVGGKITSVKTHTSGNNHPMSKLNEEKVKYILSSNKSVRELSTELGISVMSIYDVKKRRTWKHVV